MPLRKKKKLRKKVAKEREDETNKNKLVKKIVKTQYSRSKISRYDPAGVRSIYSPFARSGLRPRLSDKSKGKMLPYNSLPTGLSPKENNYIISSCQSRYVQYQKIKDLAANAIKRHKIFDMNGGSFHTVRKELIARGWVEKIPLRQMNLHSIRKNYQMDKTGICTEIERLRLSSLVEKCTPDFVWCKLDDRDTHNTIDMRKDVPATIVNKLPIDSFWTTKHGLCSLIKRNYWFYVEDLAEVTYPRTYTCCDAGEIEGFISDFKITACTSLLKWIVSMVANDRPVFTEDGKISLSVIVFALNRCKEYLFRRQHKDIDQELSSVTDGQWNTFLKRYYRIINKTDVFQADKSKIIPLCLKFAKFLLQEIYRYRPQLSCEGCHSIWMIKPGHLCRGRGIRMASQLGVITDLLSKANSEYVVQKYIEEPLLIHNTKFDIRQYYLISNTSPLVIWMYKDCYLKFSSQMYNLRNYHESIHLTNNAVQKKYKNCENRHHELPLNNMWHSDTFKSYLEKIHKDDVWDKVIYPGMKKCIVGIMMSCQDDLTACKNRFELYGCDFVLDKNFNPWLIEVNSCPDLNPTTSVTAAICQAVQADIIKVIIDYPTDSNASTGRFECIYRQPAASITRFTGNPDLSVRGHQLPPEYFLRGNVKIDETYDYADITQEKDITLIIKKIKRVYYEDIMRQPEPDSYNWDIAQTTMPHHTKLEELEELDTASCIDEQLKQIERATSNNIPDKMNLELKLEKTCRNTAEINIGDEMFNFFQLDDGPCGKGSMLDLNPIEKLFQELSPSIQAESKELREEIRRVTCMIKNRKDNPRSELERAVTNLIVFMRQKEQELLTEFKPHCTKPQGASSDHGVERAITNLFKRQKEKQPLIEFKPHCTKPQGASSDHDVERAITNMFKRQKEKQPLIEFKPHCTKPQGASSDHDVERAITNMFKRQKEKQPLIEFKPHCTKPQGASSDHDVERAITNMFKRQKEKQPLIEFKPHCTKPQGASSDHDVERAITNMFKRQKEKQPLIEFKPHCTKPQGASSDHDVERAITNLFFYEAAGKRTS